jgi:hypothetical protein
VVWGKRDDSGNDNKTIHNLVGKATKTSMEVGGSEEGKIDLANVGSRVRSPSRKIIKEYG